MKNKNSHGIGYSFEIIFRSDSLEVKEPVSGILKADEMVTGGTKNLYFIPFKDRRAVKEVGITRMRVRSLRLEE